MCDQETPETSMPKRNLEEIKNPEGSKNKTFGQARLDFIEKQNADR